MKKNMLSSLLIFFTIQFCFGQPWMTSLPIAQDLALVQNKMVLMVWEETTKYPYPVIVNDVNGRPVFIRNLFTDEYASPLIWKYFVPVIVKESMYADLYEDIKGKRPQSYIDKFNDDSIKIMDVNGNILNVNPVYGNYLNLTNLIESYYLDTSRINSELRNYKEEQNFYTSYYLAAQYLDMAIYVNKKVRPEMTKLSHIYLKEANSYVDTEKLENQQKLRQRSELLGIQEYLILNRPKKVIRQLDRIEKTEIDEANASYMAFLYFTAYKLLKKEEEAELWRSKVSLVNLKKAQLIININS